MSKLRVIIAGGGTGGHIFPAVAIGHALQRLNKETELLFVGALGRMEMERVPKEGFKIVGLDIAGFNRSNLFKNISLPYKLWKSRRDARNIIKDFAPDAIVGVGGYASFPVLYAGQMAGIPTVIQEQNSYAGKSNKILARRANKVCVAYDGMGKFFPQEKIEITGNPVRARIADAHVSREEGKKFFGLNEGSLCVLIVGGSLGARSINEQIARILETLVKEGVQVIWQTGKPYFDTAKKFAEPFGKQVRVFDFITEMECAYAAADLVISRAGALAIAELCIAARAVVFVPFPFAAEDHQTSNAQALVDKGAAAMVSDSELLNGLGPVVIGLLADAGKRQQMETNIAGMAKRNADEKIAEAVLALARN